MQPWNYAHYRKLAKLAGRTARAAFDAVQQTRENIGAGWSICYNRRRREWMISRTVNTEAGPRFDCLSFEAESAGALALLSAGSLRELLAQYEN